LRYSTASQPTNGTSPISGITLSIISYLLPLSSSSVIMAGTIFCKILTDTRSGQSCKMFLRKYTSAPLMGYRVMKSHVWKLMRVLRSEGKESSEEVTTSARSWMMNLILG
jgi:hypothetical protein